MPLPVTWIGIHSVMGALHFSLIVIFIIKQLFIFTTLNFKLHLVCLIIPHCCLYLSMISFLGVSFKHQIVVYIFKYHPMMPVLQLRNLGIRILTVMTNFMPYFISLLFLNFTLLLTKLKYCVFLLQLVYDVDFTDYYHPALLFFSC